MKKALSLSIIGVGFTAMAGQIIFIRESLTSFSSDELSIGLILASWLATGAIGSFLLGKFADRIKPGYFIFWLCQMSLIFLLPSGIICIRSARQLLQMNAGEIIPFHIVSLSSFLVLLPLCAILGFLFSLSCRLYESESSLGSGSIGKTYALDSFGSMAGGLLVSLLLVRSFNNLQIILILCLLNAGLGLTFLLSSGKFKPLLVVFNALLVIVLLFSWLLKSSDKLDTYLLARLWPGYQVLESRNSIYGNITALKRGESISLFENGTRLYTVPDRLASEEAAHFALLEQAAPKEVLLIGGGAGGLLDEIFKHPVRHVDYIELDSMIVKMSEELLPPQYSAILKNPAVSVINLDGRYFLKQKGKKYDCIIMHLGGPYTAQVNRFYTYEFFREAANRLKKDGVFSFYLNSSESYINEDTANFLRSVYATLKTAFPEIKVLPGESACFLASNSRGLLTYDYNLLMQRAKERNLDLKYIREYYLFSRLSPEKISYIEDVLSKDSQIKVNYDFRPSAYYYGIISWASRFRGSLFSKALKATDEKAAWLVLIPALITLMILGRVRKRKAPVLVSLAAAGFSQSATQVMLLFSFQIIYGYLFYKLGVLFTFFMAGLALASWWMASLLNRIKTGLRTLMGIQLGIFIFFLLLPVTLHWLSFAKGGAAIWFGANIIFPGLSLVSGLLGGMVFALANKLYFEETNRREYGAVSGLGYGLDLFGACLGAALSAIFLIPLVGVDKTCIFLALLNLAVYAGFLFSMIPQDDRKTLAFFWVFLLAGISIAVIGYSGKGLSFISFLRREPSLSLIRFFCALLFGFLILKFISQKFLPGDWLKLIGGLIFLPFILLPALRCYFKVPYVFCRACPDKCPWGLSRTFFFSAFVTLNLSGRFWCSVVCPLGTFQECQARISKKSFQPFLWLSASSYVILLLAAGMYFLALSGSSLMGFFENGRYAWAAVSVITGGLIIAGAFFIPRFWCRYFCPIGAIAGLSDKIKFFLKLNKIKK